MRFVMFILAMSGPLWIAIISVVFLLFGANRLPKLARALGESTRALKRGFVEKTD